MLHDLAVRSQLEPRLAALRPYAEREWGSMTPDQMLWHLNEFLAWSIGEGAPERQRQSVPLPAALMRFFLIYMPWPRSAPTNPHARATTTHDFEAERAKCKALIERFANRPLDGPWPVDPSFGEVTGRSASRLQAKHLDHHFRQFGG